MENNNLHKARKNKNDEFYTQIEDINAEMKHYEQHFKGKTIYMNCDDPTWSNFWRYFHIEFERLGLKKIIATHYDNNEPTYKMEYTGGDDNDIKVGVKTPLEGNGDFRNQECLDLLDEANIVVTNPPFSLFREYVACLVENDKKFIIIGSKVCIGYKEVFPLIKENKMWVGAKSMSGSLWFETPADYESKNDKIIDGKRLTPIACCWFTNLAIKKRHEWLKTTYMYAKKDELYPELYPKYDNYDAINVDKVSEIPMDYDGVMGVPITFMDKYNPEQFEILGITCRGYSPEYRTKLYDTEHYEKANDLNGSGCILVNGKPKMLYSRVLIRKKV
jgi:hypothetical protein